jgi:Caspase domain
MRAVEFVTVTGEPRPETILALVLGASRWPFIRRFENAPSFQNSAYQIAEWINDKRGLALPSRNIKDLFGSRDDAAEILSEAAIFISDHRAEAEENKNQIRDLIFYYVGHGNFHDGEFFLTVRRTTEDDPLISSITAKALGNWIRRVAKGLRTHLIIDCCFAGAVQQGFMGGALSAADVQLQEALPTDVELGARAADRSPEFGVALLAAAGPGQPARAPGGLELTMFTGELLATLRSGHAGFPSTLSLSDLHYLVSSRIQKRFGSDGAIPELRPLQQRDGRVDLLGLFPNPARFLASGGGEDKEQEIPLEDTERARRDIAGKVPRVAAERAERDAREEARQETQAEESRKAEEAHRQAEKERRAEEVAFVPVPDHPELHVSYELLLKLERLQGSTFREVDPENETAG